MVRNRKLESTSIVFEYWKDYWAHYVSALDKQNGSYLFPDSPHVLIDSIISEIEYNGLANTENRKYFLESIQKCRKTVFWQLYGDKMQLLIRNMQFPECSEYLLTICKKIINSVNKGDYFDRLVNYLLGLITTKKELDYLTKLEINKCTESIISEFITKGFELGDIADIIDKEIGVVFDASGNIIYAENEYKGLHEKDFSTKDLYYVAIAKAISGKSISERVLTIKDYFYLKPKDCIAIIRLNGLKGKDVDYMIGDINIYSPHKKKYILNESISNIEKIPFDKYLLNAAVPVKHRMLRTSISEAKSKLTEILNLIELNYGDEEKICYDEHDASVVENGLLLGSVNLILGDEDAHKQHLSFVKYSRSLDLSPTHIRFDEMVENLMPFDNINQDTMKLSRAIHWYQKGKNVTTPEDKLLFHWIALESIIKTSEKTYRNVVGRKDARMIDCLKKITVSINTMSFFYNYAYNTYLNLNERTKDWNNYYKLPQDVIDKAGLNMSPGDKVHLSKFFNTLDIIVDSIDREITKTELFRLKIFYDDNRGIKKNADEYGNFILLSYRLRNLIAHNAVYPRYIINYYANALQNTCGNVLRYITDIYKKKSRSIDEIFIDTAIKYDEFLLNFSKELQEYKSW